MEKSVPVMNDMALANRMQSLVVIQAAKDTTAVATKSPRKRSRQRYYTLLAPIFNMILGNTGHGEVVLARDGRQ